VSAGRVREQFADGPGQTQTGRWILRSQAKSQKWWPPIARQLFTKAEIRPGGTALKPQAAPAAAHEALADCVEESERVLNMLNTLLDITEAEAGMMKLRRERVDLCRMIREVVELYEDVADERKVTVRTGRHHAEIGKVSVALEMARQSTPTRDVNRDGGMDGVKGDW